MTGRDELEVEEGEDVVDGGVGNGVVETGGHHEVLMERCEQMGDIGGMLVCLIVQQVCE